MNRKPRVILADDHALFTDGLRLMLEPQYDIARIVEDGRALLDAVADLNPDLILLDIAMPLLSGLDAARQLRRQSANAKIIFLTMHADRTYVAEAFRCGAAGYLLKRSAGSELLNAIRQVLDGRQYLSPMLTTAEAEVDVQPDARDRAAVESLTPRQQQVLRLVAEGCTRKEIAARLNISVKTVEFHKAALARGFRLRNTADFTKYAIEHGFVDTKPGTT